MQFNTLVPEFVVSDINISVNFYVNILGFHIEYDRKENNFYYLSFQGAQIMLDQDNGNWVTAEPNFPRGRGLNFQFSIDDIYPILEKVKKANIPLYTDVKEHWRRGGNIEYGEVEFLIQDPDGYLLRFSSSIGERRYKKTAS